MRHPSLLVALLLVGAAVVAGCSDETSTGENGDWTLVDLGRSRGDVLSLAAVWTDAGLFVIDAHTPEGTARAILWSSEGSAEQLDLPELEWRGRYVVGWDGEVVHVWGGLDNPILGAFDPHMSDWTVAPIDSAVTGPTVWTGEEFISWTGGGLRLVDPGSGRVDHVEGFPLGGRTNPAVAWTGEGVFVWGGCVGAQCDDWFTGQDELADGAFYDRVDDAWSEVSQSPLSARDGAEAVWNGEVVVVWGGDSGENSAPGGGAFDPTTDTWEELPAAPLELPRRGHTMTVLDEGRVAVWGGHGSVEAVDVEAGEYDLNPYNTGAILTSDLRWEEMAPSPLSARDRHAAVWTGAELVVVGGCCGINGHGRWTPPPAQAP